LPDRTVLVDGNNLLHRAYAVYVTNRSDDPLISPSGYPTGLIYGFLNMLSDWVSSISDPTGISVFFDGVPRRRLAMDPDYKKKEPGHVRPGSSPARIRLCDGHVCEDELGVMAHVLSLMGADIYHHPDEEADDLIASYVRQHPSDVHVIISSDRDYYQLFSESDRLVIYRPGHAGGARFFDADTAESDLSKKYDVALRPSDILMFKALTGDPSDKIPGVPRLRKRVAAPLCRHRTVDDLMATGLPGFSKEEKRKTEELRDRLALNLRLIALDSNVDLSGSRRPALDDVQAAGRVLREDLGIVHVSPSSFRFAGSRVRHGGAVVFNPVPDFLRDI
jgi:DNA polymerase-1